jgi:hypothetical protein
MNNTINKPSAINVLFYSNHCPSSQHLISMMDKENMSHFFHRVCTDTDKVPPQIKFTPTLIIHGNPIPYVAGDAFKWLAKMKQLKMISQLQKMNNMQQQYMQNINNNLTAEQMNLLGFSKSEMNVVSDMFSFFSGNMDKECQDALPQSFFTCQDLNKGKDDIFIPPLEGGSYKTGSESTAKNKIKPEKQKELCSNLIKMRQQDDGLFEQSCKNFLEQVSNKKN